MMWNNEEIKDLLFLVVNSFQRWYLTTSKDQLLDEPYADMMWIDFGIKDSQQRNYKTKIIIGDSQTQRRLRQTLRVYLFFYLFH
ncbi:MAG: hypothetical protein EZS28_035669 [Streblomastix strix]|uniref:Uncharacterized protein n=1 Tax=Streblomastix strix TaxID=222440 RepID=A0A5J4UG25_9EUKA|nr:MAG: hypothetical protein EZS28_035669 [Streblomastix strix]